MLSDVAIYASVGKKGNIAMRGASIEPEVVDIYVGNSIRKLRKISGASQQKLADALGVSFQQVQKYERGTNRVSASTLFAIAEFFKVDFGYFVEGLKERSTAPPPSFEYFLAESDGLTIARNFLKIKNATARHQIAAMIAALAEEN